MRNEPWKGLQNSSHFLSERHQTSQQPHWDTHQARTGLFCTKVMRNIYVEEQQKKKSRALEDVTTALPWQST